MCLLIALCSSDSVGPVITGPGEPGAGERGQLCPLPQILEKTEAKSGIFTIKRPTKNTCPSRFSDLPLALNYGTKTARFDRNLILAGSYSEGLPLLDNIAVATTIYRIGQVNMANCLSAYEQIMLS